jgi:hypothetical protein
MSGLRLHEALCRVPLVTFRLTREYKLRVARTWPVEQPPARVNSNLRIARLASSAVAWIRDGLWMLRVAQHQCNASDAGADRNA